MTPTAPAREERLGAIYAFGAYFLWGFMPLYFLLLAPIGPWEVVVWRILFSLVFCAILLTVTRTWPKLLAILRDRRDNVQVLPLAAGDLAFLAALGRGDTLLAAAEAAQALQPGHEAGSILITLANAGAFIAFPQEVAA